MSLRRAVVGTPKCFPERSCQFGAPSSVPADTGISVRRCTLYEREGLRSSSLNVVSLLAV